MESGVRTLVQGSDVSILNSAWRNSQRTSEAAIYGGLRSHPTGVARFLQGGDVVFPDARDPPSGDGQPTSVLHRLILQTIGRPLWDFVSYMELLKAFRAAVVGSSASY
ncbi:hypothetical protein HGRIS_001154 [Hohenbuehelia grisea]|uniref:Uncharacterized protein n=1 Tax=Hohenbuehelia grisea TaxID=104357 RepID=A0ABR3JNF0_9AGAR